MAHHTDTPPPTCGPRSDDPPAGQPARHVGGGIVLDEIQPGSDDIITAWDSAEEQIHALPLIISMVSKDRRRRLTVDAQWPDPVTLTEGKRRTLRVAVCAERAGAIAAPGQHFIWVRPDETTIGVTVIADGVPLRVTLDELTGG